LILLSFVVGSCSYPQLHPQRADCSAGAAVGSVEPLAMRGAEKPKFSVPSVPAFQAASSALKMLENCWNAAFRSSVPAAFL
jgi:hypothetical protein